VATVRPGGHAVGRTDTRLERGTFAFPSGDTADLSITTTELAMILGGVELPNARRRTRYRRPARALG
jgi:hypothetical protein